MFQLGCTLFLLLLLISCSENHVAVRTMRDREGQHSWDGIFLSHPEELKPLYEKKRFGYTQIDFLRRGQVRVMLRDIEGGVTHKIMAFGKKVGDQQLELSCEFIASFKGGAKPENIYLRKRGMQGKFAGSLKKYPEKQAEFLSYLENSDVVKKRIPNTLTQCSERSVRVTRYLKGKDTFIDLTAESSFHFVGHESELVAEFAKKLPQGPEHLIVLKGHKFLQESWVFGGLTNRVIPSPKTLRFYVLPRLKLEGVSLIANGNKISVPWTRNHGVKGKRGIWLDPRLDSARLVAFDGNNKRELGTVSVENGILAETGLLSFTVGRYTESERLSFELDFVEADLKFTLFVRVDLSADKRVILVKPEIVSM